MDVVRRNLMTEKGYTPYCGSEKCKIMPRTRWNGGQFECPHCGWASKFPSDFIEGYKFKWGLTHNI